LELARRGDSVAFETVLADILKRDERDSSRGAAPLRMAADAIEIDTSALDIAGAFRAALEAVETSRAR
jgi:cytidylate kinase